MKALSFVGMLILLIGMALATLYLMLVGMAFSSEPGGQGSGSLGGTFMLSLPLIATLALGTGAVIMHRRDRLGLAWSLALAPIAFLAVYLGMFAF